MAGVRTLPAERVPIALAAGRVLAEPVRATAPLPPWDSSAMDGYAARAADVERASVATPVRLRVVESVAAGEVPNRVVGPGQAVRIMTGAPIPPGADSVVRIEDTDGGSLLVEIRSDRDAGRNVRPAGEELDMGDVALAGGLELDGGRLALLAALGELAPSVRTRPRVALLASGNELVEPGDAAGTVAGRVVATNTLALSALLRADGAAVVDLGIAHDSRDSVAALAAGATGCDLLVTTGGISVGAHDHTREALHAHGLELDFWRVRVRPGAQTAHGWLAQLGGIPWLGLPGNPVSAQVAYELFVRPIVRTMLGHARPFRALIPARLAEPLTRRGPDCHLLRVTLELTSDGPVARLTGPQGSNLLTSMARADGLLVVPPEAGTLPSGTPMHVMPLRDEALHSATPSW